MVLDMLPCMEYASYTACFLSGYAAFLLCYSLHLCAYNKRLPDVTVSLGVCASFVT
jgi:hypothetical protein